MSFTYTINETEHYLLVTAQGVQHTLSESLAYIKIIVDTCSERRRDRVLLDERDVAYHETMLDTHVMAEFIAEKLGDYHLEKIACVTSPRHYSQVRDFETLLKNKSLNYKAFKDMSQAQLWLTGE